MVTVKDEINRVLSNGKQILLPEVYGPQFEVIQKWLFIDFDSVERIDREGSLIDFIVRKGGGEVMIALHDGWLKLSPEQRKRIEETGKSFLLIRTDLDVDNWPEALYKNTKRHKIEMQPFGLVTHHVQVMYWVYHSKHGWQDGGW